MANNAGGHINLVLHPGHPKCGSSAIQHALRRNRTALLQRGTYFPQTRPNRLFRSVCASQDLRPLESYIANLSRDAQKAGCHTVILSSENLGVRQVVEAAGPVHELLARSFDNVDVVYYLRRQDDWMVSMWQQWGHKTGRDLAQFIDDRLGFHEPGYLAAVHLFEEIYGEDHVSAVPLHREALHAGDLLEDFARRAGTGPLVVNDSDRRANPSMSGFLCSVLARVPDVYDQNRASGFAVGVTDHSVRKILSNRVSPALLFSGDKRVMSIAERRRVMRHFERDNRELHVRHFPTLAFDSVFGVPAPTDDEVQRHLQNWVEGLTDVVAMQTQVILELLREKESEGRPKRVLARARRGISRVLRSVRRRPFS